MENGDENTGQIGDAAGVAKRDRDGESVIVRDDRIIAPASRGGSAGGGARVRPIEHSGDHAATCGTGSGNSLPATWAASFRCAMRDAGMPIFRQLWTVETGASIMEATADVPPSASMMVFA